MGFKFSRFRTSGHLDNATLPDGAGGTIRANLADDITISFMGPVYSARFLNVSGKNSLFMNIGVGYMGYTNDGTFIYLISMKGNTVELEKEQYEGLGRINLSIRLSYRF